MRLNGHVASSENEYPYPPDQFDLEADRAGAHGAHREDDPWWKRNLLYLLLALLAIIVLVFALWLLSTLGSSDEEPRTAATSSAPAAQSSASASAEPSSAAPAAPADKTRPVMVFNGSKTKGLAGDWKQALKDDGWEKVGIGSGKKSEEPGVFYKEDTDQGTAAELAKKLGVEAKKSDEHDDEITVIVTEAPSGNSDEGEQASGDNSDGEQADGGNADDGGDNGGDDSNGGDGGN